jgi:hypothetical protein
MKMVIMATKTKTPADNECDVCEAPDGEPHCNCGDCDCEGRDIKW